MNKIGRNEEVESFSLREFVKNLLIYISTSMTDYIPILYCYSMFNYTGHSNLTAQTGILYSLFIILFGFSFDYFEPVNTLCSPYLVKKNYKLFKLNLWKVFFFEMIFYASGFIVSLLLRLLPVYFEFSETMESAISLIPVYALTVGLTNMFNNFSRGKSYILVL